VNKEGCNRDKDNLKGPSISGYYRRARSLSISLRVNVNLTAGAGGNNREPINTHVLTRSQTGNCPIVTLSNHTVCRFVDAVLKLEISHRYIEPLHPLHACDIDLVETTVRTESKKARAPLEHASLLTRYATLRVRVGVRATFLRRQYSANN
jgi:hypothetical protein